MDIRLLEAAHLGDTSTLYNMIEENAYVLEKIDEPPFGATPLHIAAENGQIEFATAIMYLKPSLARKLNQSLLTPMHIALLNGKTEMVLWLLRLDTDLVRIKGKDGMTPFHYVVEQGNLDVLVAFLNACPDCIKDINVRGENGLHIALKSNNFEAFKVLLGWVRRNTHPNSDTWEKELFHGKDKEGNTVLHTAAYFNHHQVIALKLRNAMLVVTILVMTIVFQGVYSPAGGLWPADDSNNISTSPVCNITCTNNTVSPSCNVTCNNSKQIPSTITHSAHPGTAVIVGGKYKTTLSLKQTNNFDIDRKGEILQDTLLQLTLEEKIFF